MFKQKSCIGNKILELEFCFVPKNKKSCFACKLFRQKCCFALKIFEQKSGCALKMFEQKSCFTPNKETSCFNPKNLNTIVLLCSKNVFTKVWPKIFKQKSSFASTILNKSLVLNPAGLKNSLDLHPKWLNKSPALHSKCLTKSYFDPKVFQQILSLHPKCLKKVLLQTYPKRLNKIFVFAPKKFKLKSCFT